jgi:hypothetical protein
MSWDEIVEAVALRAKDPVLRTDTSSTVASTLRPQLDARQVQAIEAILGFALPPRLLNLYQRVGNGGYGPSYGLMALTPTDRASFGGNALGVLLLLRGAGFEDENPPPPPRPWPLGLLPIVHRGCSLYTVIDCLDPDLPVLTFDADGPDPDAGRPVREAAEPTGLGFVEWLRQWAMFENPSDWHPDRSG